MSSLEFKNYNVRISLFHEDKIYKISILGFTNDGGYFISDLAQVNNFKYLASKIRVPSNTNGEVTSLSLNKKDTYTIEIFKPKITHHFDGNAHVSGNGITSGYNQDGSAKGLSIKSFPLYLENDGGPVFVFTFSKKTLYRFLSMSMDEDMSSLDKKPHVILNENMVIDLRKNKGDDYSYMIEGYYILKKDIPKGVSFPSEIKKIHPSYGLMTLILLPSPSQCPGVIAIGYIKSDIFCHKDDYFSFGGAPGLIGKDETWEALTLHLLQEDKGKYKSLNYNG